MRGSQIAGVVVLAVLAVCVALGLAGLGWAYGELPPPQGQRVRGADGAIGVFGSMSYAWVLPSETGVVLVDAGDLPTAKPLLEEIGRREVRGILLTHGQADHVAGLAAFPDVPVWIADEDAGYLDGTVEEQSMFGFFRPMMGKPPGTPKVLHRYVEGEEVVVDGLAFLPVKVPGVTPGSVALLQGSTLYVGDAVWGGSPLRLPTEPFCEDFEAAKEQPKRLLSLDFDDLADGHVGFTSAARPALFRLLEEPLAPPSTGPRTERPQIHHGWLVRAAGPDVRGEQPEWLVEPERGPLRISRVPVPEHDPLVEQWVRAEGVVAGDGLVVSALAAGDTPAPADPPPTGEHLAKWHGRYVTLGGRVVGFEAHAPGAAWGSGELVLADGTRVAVHARVGVIGPDTTAVRGRVVAEDAGVHVVVDGG